MPGFYIAEQFATAVEYARQRGMNIPTAYTGVQRRLAVVSVFIPKCVFLPEAIVPVLDFNTALERDMLEDVGTGFRAIAPLGSEWNIPQGREPWSNEARFGRGAMPNAQRSAPDYRNLGVQGSIRGRHDQGSQIFIARVGCRWLRFGDARFI